LPQIKIEILIPLYYNDGRPIEEEKVSHTYNELVDRFGRCSIDNSTIHGHWKDPDTKMYYTDKNRMMWVICEDNNSNREFLGAFKFALEKRFQQQSILIHIISVTKV
jgi:hypothetical protein